MNGAVAQVDIVPDSAEVMQLKLFKGRGPLPDSTNAAPVADIVSTPDTALAPSDSLNIENPKKREPLESEVHYVARDSIRFDVKEGKVYLYGEAKINYEAIEVTAEHIEIDKATKEVYAVGVPDSTGKVVGHPKFKEKDQAFDAKTMRYNFNTKKGRITDVVTKQGEGNIRGKAVKKMEENYYYIRDGGYTTCDAEDPHFMIASRKLKVMPGKSVVSGPAYLQFEGIPTPLVIPFGFFPNQEGRRNGILLPEYGESPTLGFFFRGMGYYLHFKDKVDLAVRGDIYTGGSYGISLASNYKVRYRYNGNIEFTHNSVRGQDPEYPDFSVQNNFFIKWRHQQDPKARPSTTFNANVNAGTSTNFSNGLTSSQSDFLTNTFASSIAFSKQWMGTPFSLNLNMAHSQNTLTKQVEVNFPQIAFNMQRIYPFKRKNQVGAQRWYEKIGVSYSLRAENRVSTIDSLFFTRSTLGKMRNGISHTIPVSTNIKLFRYFTLNPNITYNERWFFQRTNRYWDNDLQALVVDTATGFFANRDVSASLNMTTNVYGLVQFKKGALRGIRHVLTPSVGFTYRPKMGSDVGGFVGANGEAGRYNPDELSLFGTSPLTNTGNITYSLSNTLEIKVRSKKDTITGFKKVKILEAFNISGAYNVFADSLNLSDIQINARTRLLDRINVNANINLSPYYIDSVGRRFNRWAVNETGELLQLTNASVAVSFNINSKGNRRPKQSTRGTPEELAMINANPGYYIDFTIPWNLVVNYNLNINPLNELRPLTQAFQFSGDFSLTPKWKIGFSSGYDFVQNDLTMTSLSIYRDLHCWQFNMTWVPFGPMANWNFTLQVKSSMLQDLKLARRKDYYDYQR